MRLKVKQALSVVFALLIIGVAYYLGYNAAPEKLVKREVKVTDTVTKYVELPIHKVRTKTYIVTKDSITEKTDTVYITDTLKSIDWEDLYKKGIYYAQADTSYNDSIFTANITYVSPVPLSPLGYFKNAFSVKTQTVYVKEEPEWWDRINISIGTTAGYGLIHNKFDVTAGLSIGYKLK